MRILGTAFIYVDGALQQTIQGSSLKFGGITNEAVTTVSGEVLRKAKQAPAVVTCTLAATSSEDVAAWQDRDDLTVQFVGDHGVTWVIGQAFLTGEPTVEETGGTISIEFTGRAAKKA